MDVGQPIYFCLLEIGIGSKKYFIWASLWNIAAAWFCKSSALLGCKHWQHCVSVSTTHNCPHRECLHCFSKCIILGILANILLLIFVPFCSQMWNILTWYGIRILDYRYSRLIKCLLNYQ